MYRQNNSGGSFVEDKERGLGYIVAIEADNAKEANDKAEEIGIYFNGCDYGRDCDCCGDRWFSCDDDDAESSPNYYGSPLEGFWGISSFIHYKDDRIEEIKHIMHRP